MKVVALRGPESRKADATDSPAGESAASAYCVNSPPEAIGLRFIQSTRWGARYSSAPHVDFTPVALDSDSPVNDFPQNRRNSLAPLSGVPLRDAGALPANERREDSAIRWRLNVFCAAAQVWLYERMDSFTWELRFLSDMRLPLAFWEASATIPVPERPKWV